MEPHGSVEREIKTWALSSHMVHHPLPLAPLRWVLGHLFTAAQSSGLHPLLLEGSLGAGAGRVKSQCVLPAELQ